MIKVQRKKKSADAVTETAVVNVDTKGGVTTAKAEVLTPDVAGDNKSKMLYADFFAEEAID